MSNEDPSGSPEDLAPQAALRQLRGSRVGNQTRAQARRDAFKAVLERLDLSPTELARRAGLTNANAFFNFLNGRSGSLSQETVDKILAVLPGVSPEELTAQLPPDAAYRSASPWAAPGTGWPILIYEAEAGVWRQSAKLPPTRWASVPMPTDLPSPGPAAFAVRIKGAGAERLYSWGTVAICLPLPELLPLVHSGCRILVHRERVGRHELTLRELVIDGGKAWLWPRSSHPEHQIPVAVPWPLREPGLAYGSGADELVLIKGVVIATWQPEAALDLA